MPILNYTTEIDAGRTVAEIQRKIARAGAASVRVDYKNGQPVSILFLLMLGDRPLPFRLPADTESVYWILFRDDSLPRKYRSRAHAERVAWRIVKDWVEVQLALIESGQASLPQLFLPHAVQPDGRTLFEVVAADPHLLLGQGGES
jgi:hypothetical protein